MAVPVVSAGTGGESGSASGIHLQILGPLRLWRGDIELDAGPRQQAYLLALLLARTGRLISTSQLVDLIWDDAPASAVNLIHKYVGTLRRLLEPGLPIRGTGSYLQRRGNRYLFMAGPGMLDLAVFREHVQHAEAALTQQKREAALDRYVEALALWQGPAGDNLAYVPAAMSVFAGLDDEFFAACVAAAELAVSLGRPERVLPPLRLAASMAPLHEPVQAGLVSTLGAAGQHAEALAVYRAVRARLAEQLGIDPGPALQAAHQQVLGDTPAPAAGRSPDGRTRVPRQAPPASRTQPAAVLVGRTEEFAVLRQAAELALAGGKGLVVVDGEPGVGKTRLLEEIATDADRRGALVAWGRCLPGEGTPPMWPWVKAVGTVLDALPTETREKWRAGALSLLTKRHDDGSAAPAMPDGGVQFRLFEGVAAAFGEASALRPLLLVIDDLQWADVASLQLFSHLADHLPEGTVIVGALRDRAPTPGTELSRMLAAASRISGHRRIHLGPLSPPEVAEIVRVETGRLPDPDAARGIHARTAGNPFFVRELSRLLAEHGLLTPDAVTRAGVPSTVRDVVRDRMAGLADGTRDLLQIAALIGGEVDLDLLARAAGLDVPACLDHLEPLEALGLLEPVPDDPYAYRFAHDLVRQSVAGTTPRRRTSQWHLDVAEALELTAPAGEPAAAERLAYHLRAAGPLAHPARTAQAKVRADRRAAAKPAFDAAEHHLRMATQVARTAGLPELELSALTQHVAVVGMRSMYGPSAVDLLERAEQLARNLGRELEATDFLYSRWSTLAQTIQLHRSGPLARRLLEQGRKSTDPIVHAYGLHAWGTHQWDLGHLGEAYRYMSRFDEIAARDHRHQDNPVRHDHRMLMHGLFAQTTLLHGDLEQGRALFDKLEAEAGDAPYPVTIWAAIAAWTASMIGDTAWALRAAERGIAADPDFSYAVLGTYSRLSRCWALAMTGQDPTGDATAEAMRIIAANLLDPPVSCVSTWYGLLAEMRLAAGEPAQAAEALDRADHFLDAYGQRYSEGLILLLRARALRALGKPGAVVRAAAEKALALSTEREAHLFAHRAREFLTELGEQPAGH